MKTQDFRLGQNMSLAGEVRTVTMLDGDDKLLPDGVVDVTMRVTLADQIDYLRLLDKIVAGLRGDDQENPGGMISVNYAEEMVREEFEAAATIPERTEDS